MFIFILFKFHQFKENEEKLKNLIKLFVHNEIKFI